MVGVCDDGGGGDVLFVTYVSASASTTIQYIHTNNARPMRVCMVIVVVGRF